MIDELLYYVKRPFHLVKTGFFNALPAVIRYGFPQRHLKIIAITGTDGKTTSSTLTYHVLKSAGYKVALISTVAAYIGDQQFDTGFHVTSPLPSQVFKFMRMAVDQGCTHIIIETTSHGIYQSRTWGWRPEIAGLTNISHEHLDYHLTYDRYVSVKAELLAKAHTAILHSNDPSYQKVRRELKSSRASIVEYSTEEKWPKNIKSVVEERFPESYNQANARLVYTIANLLGVSAEQFAQAVSTFPGIPGRMERVNNRRGLDIVVDFAHTPQALEEALSALRRQQTDPKAALIAVFGCAGLRDHTKRPLMTKVAVNYADHVVLTAEDPRTEDVWSIIRQMKEQLTEGHDQILTIADRQMAITFAITELAKKGDTVAIFGKGHEQSMCFGTTEYPWSDQGAVKIALGQAPA